MALESKPLFHPEVIRQQVRAFSLPERAGDWQPKLQHWAGLIASGRADDFKETALLPDFLTDIFCGLFGSFDPARDLVNQGYALTPAEIVSPGGILRLRERRWKCILISTSPAIMSTRCGRNGHGFSLDWGSRGFVVGFARAPGGNAPGCSKVKTSNRGLLLSLLTPLALALVTPARCTCSGHALNINRRAFTLLAGGGSTWLGRSAFTDSAHSQFQM